MTQFTPNTMAGTRAKSGPTVYTLMLVIAFLALVVACGYVLFRQNELFGTWNPFELVTTTGVASLLKLPGLLG